MEETQLKFSEVLASLIVAVLVLAFCIGAVSFSVILTRMAFGF